MGPSPLIEADPLRLNHAASNNIHLRLDMDFTRNIRGVNEAMQALLHQNNSVAELTVYERIRTELRCLSQNARLHSSSSSISSLKALNLEECLYGTRQELWKDLFGTNATSLPTHLMLSIIKFNRYRSKGNHAEHANTNTNTNLLVQPTTAVKSLTLRQFASTSEGAYKFVKEIIEYLPNLKELKLTNKRKRKSEDDDNKNCHINKNRANYQKLNTNPVNVTTLVKELLQQKQLQTLCLHKVLYKDSGMGRGVGTWLLCQYSTQSIHATLASSMHCLLYSLESST